MNEGLPQPHPDRKELSPEFVKDLAKKHLETLGYSGVIDQMRAHMHNAPHIESMRQTLMPDSNEEDKFFSSLHTLMPRIPRLKDARNLVAVAMSGRKTSSETESDKIFSYVVTEPSNIIISDRINPNKNFLDQGKLKPKARETRELVKKIAEDSGFTLKDKSGNGELYRKDNLPVKMIVEKAEMVTGDDASVGWGLRVTIVRI